MHLVLLPGMNCSPRLWRDVLPHLPQDVTPITPHLEGPSLDDTVELLLATLPDRFALAGLSLGGIVGMALTRTAPERVERLCLVDTNARPPTDAQTAGWQETLSRLDAGASAEDVQASLLPMLLAPSTLDHDQRLVDETLAMARQVGAGRLASQLRLQLTRIDERHTLREVGVPTAVVAGQLDALCPVTRHQEIASLVPDSRLTVVDGAGHLSPLERPAAVGATMAEWLLSPPGQR